jgi:nucleoid-associated protein YgaU
MVDPAVKIATAFCVLLAGVCAAMLFRHNRPLPAVSPPAAAQLQIPARADAVVQTDPRVGEAPVVQRPVTVVKPLTNAQSPPPLGAKYPENDPPASSRWGGSIDMLMPAKETARSHRIVDGDTLAALAQRYLGSPSRAGELFEANRDVLSDPELLPIGTELKIPANDARQSPP